MSTPSKCETPCDTCEKTGLPLLLTRYAVFSHTAGTPAPTGTLKDALLDQIALGDAATYGVRLLRSGYVYVYDERGYWDEYFVTVDGFLTKLPVRSKVIKVRPAPRTNFACARNGTAPLAGVITIRNPNNAKAIWIGFSDVEWTDATFEKHMAPDYRAKHMTKIQVSGGKVGAQQRTAPITDIDKLVPEFMLSAEVVRKQVTPTTPFQFNTRLTQVADFKQAVAKIAPTGGAAIVAVNDPVGLAMEIASLMEVRKVIFINHESVAKPRFAASAIASLESSIKEQAKLAEIVAGEELAQREEAGPGAWNPNPALSGMPGDLERAERWRTHTPQSLQRVADSAWRNYSHDRTGKPRFAHGASKEWLKTYNEGFEKFDAQYIAPLARAHVKWMSHQCLADHLSCNHDEGCMESGVAFTKTVAELLNYTTDKQPSYDLYLSWLRDGKFVPNNLIMRALAFNQKDLIEKLEQADSAPIDGRAFPSDAVASAVGAYMEKMPATTNAQLTALMAGLSGPALKYWDDFNTGKVTSKAAAAMAGVSGKQFVRLPIVGNRGQFIQAYVKELYRLDPNLKTNTNQLQKAVAAQVDLLKIEGVPTQAKSKLGWYVLLDRQVVTRASTSNLSGQALANELAKAVLGPQDLQKIDLASAAKFRGNIAGSATVLGGVLMLWNYSKLMSDVKNSMSHARSEAVAKLSAGTIAIGGFVAEQLGGGLEKLGEARLRNMAGRYGAYAPQALKLFGRVTGFGVGVFLGLWDLSNWWGERAKGDIGLSNAYFISGVSGMGIAGALFGVAMGWITLGPIGWLVVAVGLLIWLGATLFIEKNKDNGLQEWLSRCHFGAGTEKYPDTATHVKQYKLALGE